MLNLKAVLESLGVKQKSVATEVGVSTATVAQIVNHGLWPKSFDRAQLQGRIVAVLREKGAEETAISTAFDEAGAATPEPIQRPEEDMTMLLRNQRLTPEAAQQFGLVGDPFGPVMSPDQIYLTHDIRYARESLWHAAIHADRGTITAIIGESGSGKSTLRRDLRQRLADAQKQVILIEPFVFGMEATDQKGKTLKVGQIAERVIRTLAPEERLRASQDARFDQMTRLLLESARGGFRHLLIIEEAHALPKPTLRHLKRLVELEHGMRFLMSVVLIGQTELYDRLSETDPEVREVVQRCGICTLHPLPHAEGFLRARLAVAGVDLAKLVNGAGLAALEERLRPEVQRGRQTVRDNLLYPLALQNLFVAALNKAAALGFEVVDADVVRGV